MLQLILPLYPKQRLSFHCCPSLSQLKRLYAFEPDGYELRADGEKSLSVGNRADGRLVPATSRGLDSRSRTDEGP